MAVLGQIPDSKKRYIMDYNEIRRQSHAEEEAGREMMNRLKKYIDRIKKNRKAQ